jgi:hypothetical protein
MRMAVEREDKPAWSVVPAELKVAVAHVLGSPVVRAVRAFGGYGPSATYLLTQADGRRAFFKGTYPLPSGSGVQWSLEQEEVIYRRLGRYIRPWAPEYLGSVRADGWHGLLLELVGGRSALPWTKAKAKRAARSHATFHDSTLGRPLPRWLSRSQHRDFSAFWRQLAADPAALDRLAALAGPRRADAREWLRVNAGTLGRVGSTPWRATKPHALLHFDTRSDNVRLEGNLLRIFDWSAASVGPAEFDIAAFAQSIEAEGGPKCEAVAGWYETVLPLRHDVLVGSVAGISGYFADRAPRPPVPGLPRLRSIQRSQLSASLSWAARLLDLPEPSWLGAVPP